MVGIITIDSICTGYTIAELSTSILPHWVQTESNTDITGHTECAQNWSCCECAQNWEGLIADGNITSYTPTYFYWSAADST